MSDADTIAERVPGWQHTAKPARLDRKFTFESYGETREFLDRMAELSKTDGYYPDLSFGRTHVSVTMTPRDEQAFTDADIAFANSISGLID